MDVQSPARLLSGWRLNALFSVRGLHNEQGFQKNDKEEICERIHVAHCSPMMINHS
jgi:hypothetical protein